MTFSVDVDFSPFQAGPPQDATARRSAGEGRGKDFAGSLFGVARDTAPPESLPVARNAHAAFSLLNFPQTPPSPENLLLSSTASATMFPALPTEGEVFEAETPVPPASSDLEGPEKDIAEAVDLFFPEPIAQAGQSAGVNSEKPGMTVSGRPAELSSPGPEPAVAAPPVPEANTVETGEGKYAFQPAATPAAAFTPIEGATSLSAQIGLAAATPPDAGAQAIELSAEMSSVQASANLPVLGETPASLLPVAVVTSNPANATVLVPVDQAAALVGLQSGSKTGPQTMANSAELNRRSAPAGGEPPTHADLTAELVSNQADAALPEMLPVSSDPGPGGDAATGSTQTSPALSGTLGGALSQTAASSQPSGAPATPQLAHNHTALIATATQLPDIVARATGNGQEDSIVVQLDPPELGRVSIDFKFDAQGLQHVTITAESPEAMRQLRQMHFELVQALERNGLSSQNMSFQHQNPQQNEGWGQQTKFNNVKFDSPALSGGGLVIAADNNPHRQIASGGRLDLRL